MQSDEPVIDNLAEHGISRVGDMGIPRGRPVEIGRQPGEQYGFQQKLFGDGQWLWQQQPGDIIHQRYRVCRIGELFGELYQVNTHDVIVGGEQAGDHDIGEGIAVSHGVAIDPCAVELRELSERL